MSGSYPYTMDSSDAMGLRVFMSTEVIICTDAKSMLMRNRAGYTLYTLLSSMD